MAEALLRAPKPRAHKLAITPAPLIAQVEEYERLAGVVGIKTTDLRVEQFQHWLERSGITVFNLEAVQKYMDRKSLDEKGKAGWQWRPLRAKDRVQQSFGTAPRKGTVTTTYDHYSGARHIKRRAGRNGTDYYSSKLTIYNRIIPLHALRKVARIEEEQPGAGAVFMVSDYAPTPTPKQIEKHIRPPPDPFLMVVIPNAKLAEGVGRWVIDFWDEPGFGLKMQLGV